jgi:hypothetical protein
VPEFDVDFTDKNGSGISIIVIKSANIPTKNNLLLENEGLNWKVAVN